MTAVIAILHKELRDGLRNRWLWLFATALGGLALALGGLALADDAGRVGVGRTLAGLINLILLLTPLMGLTLGAQSIAGERERRVLPFLLAQPVGRGQVLLGKFLGLALALGAALGLGFGLAALVLAGANAALYLAVTGLALLLGLISLSLGLLVSVLARRMAVAFGVAVFVWFGLILLADLGLMGTTLALRLRADTVFLLALTNPLQVFKLAALSLVRPSLDVLGPAGLYGTATFGIWLTPGLIGLLLAWVVLPLVLALAFFVRGGEP